jgi:hypothetical protein
MENPNELRETICSLLTEEPINLLEIGPTLVTTMGYSQDAIVNALYWLVSEKRIELMSGNRVRLL